MNLTILQAVVRTAFWSVLPIIGFPAEMITTVLIIHGLYPFFTHTQLVGKLGILEYVLVPPSHHRVHHASNEIYLDKNYGDMFIIWDKLFGTFAKEAEPAVYGLTKPLNSYSFLWQHFHFFVELRLAIKDQRGILNRLKVAFGSPADFDPELRSRAEKRFLSHRKVEAPTQRFRGYVLGQLSLTLFVLFGLLLFEHYAPLWLQVAVALLILLTLINSGAILEQRRWVFYLEYLRVWVIVIIIYCYYPLVTSLVLIALLWITLFCFKQMQKQYLRLVYGHL
jgi:alkylglycerol monooxygenase